MVACRRQLERLLGHRDELVLALAESEALHADKQDDLQRLATVSLVVPTCLTPMTGCLTLTGMLGCGRTAG